MIKLPTPSFDLTNLDLTKLDLSALDLRELGTRSLGAVDQRVVRAARDVTFVTIGFGVLGFQKAQVRRREIERALAGAVRAGRSQLGAAVRVPGRQVDGGAAK